MAEVKITNLVKFYTICLLSEGPKHGYEIIREISKKLESRISPGQIYPFLNRLEKNKLIESKKAGTRKKKVYQLTKKGKAFSKKMLHRFGGLIDIAVEPRLSVCVHCGCRVYGGGHTEKIKGKKMVFCCHHCARAFRHE